MIELALVVGIIGFLAAIAIPRFSRGPAGARASVLVGHLRIVRGSISFYAAEHGRYPGPDEATFVAQMITYSDAEGKTSDTRSGAYIFGPYLAAIPACPIKPNLGSTGVLIDPDNSPPHVDPGSGEGWVYNPNTGEFIVNAETLPNGVTQTLKAGGTSVVVEP
jgi:general secretion pathway protein G